METYGHMGTMCAGPLPPLPIGVYAHLAQIIVTPTVDSLRPSLDCARMKITRRDGGPLVVTLNFGGHVVPLPIRSNSQLPIEIVPKAVRITGDIFNGARVQPS